jgi:pimeloyl-ACP methyl ester carboxylesterase
MMLSVSRIAAGNGTELFVRECDFTDPAHESPVALLLHGTAEDGEAFRRWIPALAPDFRILCPDLRGAGRSTPIARGAEVELDELVADAMALLDALGVERCALVGEKVGALLALRFAARHPARVCAVAVAAGMIAPRDVLGPWIPGWMRTIEERGVRAWVDATQGGRMGSELSPAALEWWSALMARSDRDSLLAYLRMLGRLALGEDELRAIEAPTLFLVPARSPGDGAAFEQRRPAAEILAWQALVPRHERAAIDAASYHLAATHPEACAEAVRRFLLRVVRETPRGQTP